uniref:uncharacterized protein isoform X6 n=1 Tax=Myxine glutinosa TaxID=7769 RepID=UPI00358EF013
MEKSDICQASTQSHPYMAEPATGSGGSNVLQGYKSERLRDLLDNVSPNEEILGLYHIEEHLPTSGTVVLYSCSLCNTRGTLHAIAVLAHVAGFQHRFTFLLHHYPEQLSHETPGSVLTPMHIKPLIRNILHLEKWSKDQIKSSTNQSPSEKPVVEMNDTAFRAQLKETSKQNEPIVGMHYITLHFSKKNPSEAPYYSCRICGVKLVQSIIIGHITGNQHREIAVYAAFGNIVSVTAIKAQRIAILRTFCAILEKKENDLFSYRIVCEDPEIFAPPVPPNEEEPIIHTLPHNEIPHNETGEMPPGEMPCGKMPRVETLRSEASRGETSRGATQLGERSRGEMSLGEIQCGEMQRGEFQRGEMPWGEMPWGERQRGEMLRGETPRGEMQRGEMQRGEMQRGSTQRGSTQRGSTQRGSTQRGEMPWGEMPWGERLWCERLWCEMQHGEMPWGERPRGEMPRGEMPRSDRPRSDRPRSDRPPSDRPPSDRPPSERPPSERPPSERPPSERPPSERPQDLDLRSPPWKHPRMNSSRMPMEDFEDDFSLPYAEPMQGAFERWLDEGSRLSPPPLPFDSSYPHKPHAPLNDFQQGSRNDRQFEYQDQQDFDSRLSSKKRDCDRRDPIGRQSIVEILENLMTCQITNEEEACLVLRASKFLTNTLMKYRLEPLKDLDKIEGRQDHPPDFIRDSPVDFPRDSPVNFPRDHQRDLSNGRQLDCPRDSQLDCPRDSQQDFPIDRQLDFPGDRRQDFPGFRQLDFPRDSRQDFPRDRQNDFPGDRQQDFPGDCQQDFPKDFPPDLPKDLPPDFPKDLPPDFPKDLPPDFPKDLPPDFPKDLPPDSPKDFPPDFQRNHPLDLRGNLSLNLLRHLPLDYLRNLPQDVLKNLPQDVLKNLPQDVLKNLPQDFLKDLSPDILKNFPPDFLTNLQPDSSRNLPPEFPGNLPPDFPGNLPPDFPGNLPPDFPRNLPPDFPMNLPPDFPMNLPPDFPMNLPPDFPRNPPPDFPRNLPPYFPGNLPPYFPGNLPPYFPGNLPPDFPRNLPSDFPRNLPPDFPRNLPPDFPRNLPPDFPRNHPPDIPSNIHPNMPRNNTPYPFRNLQPDCLRNTPLNFLNNPGHAKLQEAKTHMLGDLLAKNARDEAILGLSHINEHLSFEGRNEVVYSCSLCGCRPSMHAQDVRFHVIGFRHRVNFLERYCPIELCADKYNGTSVSYSKHVNALAKEVHRRLERWSKHLKKLQSKSSGVQELMKMTIMKDEAQMQGAFGQLLPHLPGFHQGLPCHSDLPRLPPRLQLSWDDFQQDSRKQQELQYQDQHRFESRMGDSNRNDYLVNSDKRRDPLLRLPGDPLYRFPGHRGLRFPGNRPPSLFNNTGPSQANFLQQRVPFYSQSQLVPPMGFPSINTPRNRFPNLP